MNKERGEAAATRVYLELGAKRAFACALDWPGWCRSDKDGERALEALAAYAPRYAIIAAEAGLPLPLLAAQRLEVVDELAGNATTDFGAPAEIVPEDYELLSEAVVAKISKLVAASWTVFDRISSVAPANLRKGPRGGGRDRDAVIEHVFAAETAYARRIGVRRAQPPLGDTTAIASLRGVILVAIRDGAGPPDTSWPARYAARRIAWHVLDHAWEIEDRGSPP